MKTLLSALLFLAMPFSALAAVPSVIIDVDGPSHPAESLELEELWRAGGEDGEIIFGRISDVIRHANGEFYVLDNQLCQVEVFDPTGEHLRTLSRQGDGPGEVRQPIGLAFLPDDLIGVGAGYPGKMVTLDLEGTPVSTRYPIGEPSDGNIGVMISMRTGGGVLAATGGRLVFEGPDKSYTERFLAVSDAQGGEFTRILQRKTPMDPTGLNWDEEADYYFDRWWELGPDGLIYVPMERDKYEVSVFDRSGALQFAFGRDLECRRRTNEDKDEASPIINLAGGAERSAWKVCDRDEAVARIMVNPDDGNVWVLTPHGANDQPEGVLETWDVFGPRGDYLKQVAVPNLSDIQDGAAFLVGGGHLVVIRGTGSSFHGQEEDLEDDGEVEPLEVICYAVR